MCLVLDFVLVDVFSFLVGCVILLNADFCSFFRCFCLFCLCFGCLVVLRGLLVLWVLSLISLVLLVALHVGFSVYFDC